MKLTLLQKRTILTWKEDENLKKFVISFVKIEIFFENPSNELMNSLPYNKVVFFPEAFQKRYCNPNSYRVPK